MNLISSRKPRIVIYGTGQFGCHIARFAHARGWPIVAAYNRAGSKVGQDIGRLAGLARDIGVTVQDCDTASYANLDADIGIVTTMNRLRDNFPAHQRLLNAGLNVLCHGIESYYPQGCDAEHAAVLDALARQNGVTFTGGGIWDMSRIWSGILVAGTCTEIRSLFHSSITDGARDGIEQMRYTGAGLTIAQFRERLAGVNAIVSMYKTIPEHVLAALGYTISADRVWVEPVVLDEPLYCALLERDIPAGDCIGTRINAEIETEQGVKAKAVIELRLFKPGEVEHMFWSVDGMPRTRIRVERDDSAHATASCLFNRIPDVIAACPGIVPVSRLGPLRASVFM